MNWTDAKKWRMDMLSKLLMAVAIAVVGALSAVLIDQRFKSQLAENNKQLQQELARDRFRLNRLEVETQALESLAGEFMHIAYAYSVALESAFNDVYFKHDQFNAQNKGKNQEHYENELHPKIMALSDQLVARCPDVEPAIVELRATRKAAFLAYDAVEDQMPSAMPTQSWIKSKDQIEELVPKIRSDAVRAYVLVENCVERMAHEAEFGKVGT